MKYWEDFVVGSETVHGEHEITADEIVRFAREFDPQPFHTDPDVEGPFGGLIASGWHTASLYMGMFVRNALLGRSRVVDAWVSERARAWHDRRRARARQPVGRGRHARAC